MFRRVIVLMMLPCVLLTQSAAALGHSHGANDPAGHGHRPHIHLKPRAAVHRHGHHHHGPAGHHHHASDVIEEAHPSSRTDVARQSMPVSHDSDAVFVAKIDAVMHQRCVTDAPRAASPPCSSFEALLTLTNCESPVTCLAYWMHPPPTTGEFCALYVRHLALLL